VRVTLAQLNPTVGDLAGNSALIAQAIEAAERDGADLLITPELAVLGYPPRDLLLRAGVAEASRAAVDALAEMTKRVTALIGFAEPWSSGTRPCRNAVAICRNGRVERVYAKRLLPTYDVFDEARYFQPGQETVVIEVAGERVGVLVCEDLWRASDVARGPRYEADPVTDALVQGAKTLAVLSASPFVSGKERQHHERLMGLARRGVRVLSVNQVGGNDDLIFDGRSRAYAAGGAVVARLAAFESETRTVECAERVTLAPTEEHELDETIHALTLGIRDYLRKTGHRSAVLGLSGGIDSALVAALAARAIGPAQVTGLLMPSRYSSPGSIGDALDSARRLGLAAAPTVAIEPAHAAIEAMLASTLGGLTTADGRPLRFDGLPDENIQSRLRGLLVMAHSNATGAIVLTTGNKSEYATGYATLYGDMNGGLAPIGDLLKTEVYAIARRLNEDPGRFGFARPPIPEASITKAPSAELRPDQTDQDSLPPYEVLDAIVRARVEGEQDIDGVMREAGVDRPTAERWCRLIDRMQYKRDQAAIILKRTPRAFGRGRPMPIASRTNA